MNLMDIVLILILVAFAVSGSKRGTILTAGQFIGAIFGFFLARAWFSPLGSLLAFFMPHRPGLAQLIAFILIFFLIERAIGFLVKITNSVFKIFTALPIISSIDSLIAAVIGFLEGLVFTGASIYLILSLRLDATLMAWLSNSLIARYIHFIFQSVLGYFL